MAHLEYDILQTISDFVGVTDEAFSGVATIAVTKDGKYICLFTFYYSYVAVL